MEVQQSSFLTSVFMCVIPVVCVTNKEGGVVKQHNLTSVLDGGEWSASNSVM